MENIDAAMDTPEKLNEAFITSFNHVPRFVDFEEVRVPSVVYMKETSEVVSLLIRHIREL